MANLLTAEDSSFEGGTIGQWTDGIGTAALANSTAQAYSGTHSLSATTGASGLNISSGNYPIQPGQLYSGTAHVYAVTTGIVLQYNVDWRTAAKAYISANQVTITTSVGAWSTISVPAGVAPSTAAFANVNFFSNVTTAGLVHYLDALSLDVYYPGFFASVGKPGPRVSNRSGGSQGGY